jgi:hypothetical protein
MTSLLLYDDCPCFIVHLSLVMTLQWRTKILSLPSSYRDRSWQTDVTWSSDELHTGFTLWWNTSMKVEEQKHSIIFCINLYWFVCEYMCVSERLEVYRRNTMKVSLNKWSGKRKANKAVAQRAPNFLPSRTKRRDDKQGRKMVLNGSCQKEQHFRKQWCCRGYFCYHAI